MVVTAPKSVPTLNPWYQSQAAGSCGAGATDTNERAIALGDIVVDVRMGAVPPEGRPCGPAAAAGEPGASY
jgi:hypothetical protein